MSSFKNLSPRLDNLPAPLSSFVGRRQEIVKVKQLLAGHRLVTLTGPGGCGKTRLALRVAGELREEFRDGIWLTEFASIFEPELVDRSVATTLAQEALEICRQLGQEGELGVAQAHDLLGELAIEIGDYQTAAVLIEDALNIYRGLHKKRGTAEMLMQLGWAAMRAGDYPRAELLVKECLPMIQEVGDSDLLGEVLSGMGELAVRQGKFDHAKRLLEDGLVLQRKLGERWGVAASLGSLGWAALLQRDYERMREVMRGPLLSKSWRRSDGIPLYQHQHAGYPARPHAARSDGFRDRRGWTA